MQGLVIREFLRHLNSIQIEINLFNGRQCKIDHFDVVVQCSNNHGSSGRYFRGMRGVV